MQSMLARIKKAKVARSREKFMAGLNKNFCQNLCSFGIEFLMI